MCLYNEATFFWGYKKAPEQQRICTFFRLLCASIPPPHLLTVQICVVWNENSSVPNPSCWLQLNALLKPAGPCRLFQVKYTKTASPEEGTFMAATDLKRSFEQVKNAS